MYKNLFVTLGLMALKGYLRPKYFLAFQTTKALTVVYIHVIVVVIFREKSFVTDVTFEHKFPFLLHDMVLKSIPAFVRYSTVLADQIFVFTVGGL